MKQSDILIRSGLLVAILAAVASIPIDEEKSASVLAQSLIENQLQNGLASMQSGDGPAELWMRSGADSPLDVYWKEAEVREGSRPNPRWRNSSSSSTAVEVHSEKTNGFLTVRSTWTGPKIAEPILQESTGRIGSSLSLIPPLTAVLIALLFQRILLALVGAVWMGVCLHQEVNPLMGAFHSVTDVLIPVVADAFNLKILGFTFALVGMVAVVTRMGGTKGLIDKLAGNAQTPRGGQITTGLMGLVIFFDDYANTVVVGSAARKLTDGLRISREKLAYIVDSTSAPIAGLALVSTWIGYEVGLFTSILPSLRHVEGLPAEGYGLFFEALPSRFYCFFALALVFLSAGFKRDMGPMLRAEQRARRGGGVLPPAAGQEEARPQEPEQLEKPGVPARWWNAALPIGTVLLGTLTAIALIGGGTEFSALSGASWRDAFAGAEDHIPSILLYSALGGGLLAILLAVSQNLLGPIEAIRQWGGSMIHLVEAGAILILAWAIKMVCDDLHTGMALVALIGDGIAPEFLPLVVFVLSAVVAFFTGTSWGTMALFLPVAAPLAATLSGDPLIVIICVGAVLDGAICGDHCSPISDTTVLSSTATGCPHVAHVRTQIPYAILAMSAAGIGGYLTMGYGAPIGIAYLGGLGILLTGLFVWGKDPDKTPDAA